MTTQRAHGCVCLLMHSGLNQPTVLFCSSGSQFPQRGCAIPIFGEAHPSSVGVQHRMDAFSPFVQYVRPLPPRSARQFYGQSLGKHAIHAYHNSFNRYIDELKENPRERTRLTVLSALLTLAATAFRRHHQFVEGAFLALFINYPVISALNILPRIKEAYALEKSGEPNRAEKKFSKALEDLFFNTYQKYFRPVTVGLLLFYPLLNFKRTGLGWIQQACRWSVRRLGHDSKAPATWPRFFRAIHRGTERLGNTRPVLWLDRQTNRIGNWGDKLLQPLERWFDRFKF